MGGGRANRTHKCLLSLLDLSHVMRGGGPGIERRDFFLGRAHGSWREALNMGIGAIGIPPLVFARAGALSVNALGFCLVKGKDQDMAGERPHIRQLRKGL